ncbi:TrmH family RNA methyltransferase [Phenylobacterium montanum]|uniref:RNA methyltransferase n=1 Tax=Phenylobacterium montanum TaxID=2823693 RepID=A0A975FY78_9CAUL|nr:RNA methyltransferase [Caulobacter sp. S6]QUD87658.1 RNA methyltransferase [Caulobacter sp. S6]
MSTPFAPIAIDDPDDPRIAGYRNIREKDLVGRQGLFVAEGEVVLRMLLAQSRHAPLSILIAAKRAESLAPLLARASPETPVFAAGQAVMDQVVGFPIHRGILALARRAPEPTPSELLAGLPGRALALALFGIANHDNMGGLFRNAAAFGVGAVLLDAECCDPLYRKAIRVSVGGALVTPFARFGPNQDPITLLRDHGFEPLALTPRGRTRLIDLKRPPRAALLLGAEGPGLAEALIARASDISIPMSAGFDSLNVAACAAIALHQLAFGSER